MKFRKKPVVIEAVQLLWSTWSEVCEFVTVPGFVGCYIDADGKQLPYNTSSERMGAVIPTLEGEMLAHEGDWIIKGIKGEFYPCKPDIFEATYEACI